MLASFPAPLQLTLAATPLHPLPVPQLLCRQLFPSLTLSRSPCVGRQAHYERLNAQKAAEQQRDRVTAVEATAAAAAAAAQRHGGGGGGGGGGGPFGDAGDAGPGPARRRGKGQVVDASWLDAIAPPRAAQQQQGGGGGGAHAAQQQQGGGGGGAHAAPHHLPPLQMPPGGLGLGGGGGPPGGMLFNRRPSDGVSRDNTPRAALRVMPCVASRAACYAR
jgi:hypothetical protein